MWCRHSNRTPRREHLDGFDLDMPGTFSTDPDSIASITGRLQMAAHSFYQMSWEYDDEI